MKTRSDHHFSYVSNGIQKNRKQVSALYGAYRPANRIPLIHKEINKVSLKNRRSLKLDYPLRHSSLRTNLWCVGYLIKEAFSTPLCTSLTFTKRARLHQIKTILILSGTYGSLLESNTTNFVASSESHTRKLQLIVV